MAWILEKDRPTGSPELRKLYEDFAVVRAGRYGCPPSFNRLTMAWFLNEPKTGDRPNVGCDAQSYDFFALRNIKTGEELTVDYSKYSESSF
jgi:hypothetical protein